jgi:hypothetical protein
MEDYEKLGVFYLGRQYDLEQKQPLEHLILYDSKDLVTHAVCVGMTGSGKTGLCIGLIEEAAIDNVPAILIDPKGDLSNLLLTFPQLRGDDFLPWINLDDARQKNLSPQEFANQQAELWRAGLAKWGESGERIQRLRDSADFCIYTPGSNAGFPVSILKSFAAPGARLLEDNELLRERISTTVTSLLGLLGVEADPLQSREHILLSTILDTAWRQGQDLDLAGLIQQVQNPPLSKIGVLDLETFYPAKDRFGLVLMLNNLLASPGFNAWMEGEALDIGQILYTPAGKPRVAIFSIAHLSDAERMFFVSLLLNQVLGWMRTQSGTTSLRAILYMDEIFGYLPPLSNPPSKLPMLTLLKQGRAFGLGVVLATQNPVDLDYKALSNTGTWFVGRLQTERDKARLLDGLEGAAATTGAQFDRQTMETILSGLGNRIFLMNNTHEDAPVLMQTRWALSYLRGPLSRDQIKTLMDPMKATTPAPAVSKPAPAPVTPTPAAPVATPALATASSDVVAAGPASAGQPPALPPDISNFYIPQRGSAPSGFTLCYRPVILGAARLTFSDSKAKVDKTQDLVYTTPVTDQVIAVDWANAQKAGLALSDLEKSGQTGAQYTDLPAVAMQSRSYNAWSKDFTDWLYGNQRLEVLRSPSTGSLSRPGESERDFRIRLQQEARETRDEATEKLRQKYAPKFNTLQERLRRAQQAVERESAQAKQAELQTAISFGATLLSAFTGRKAVSRSTLGRATTAARGVSRSMEQRQDIDRAKDTVGAIQTQMKDLQDQFDAEVAALQSKIDPMTEELQTLAIRPKKTDISVQLLALVWAPYWLNAQGTASQAF